jgi:ferric-dicitrate binding protein FerR (iron transport regulator)
MKIQRPNVTRAQLRMAAYWYTEFEDGAQIPQPERWAQFQAWLDASPQHAAAYHWMQQCMRRVERAAVRLRLRPPSLRPS